MTALTDDQKYPHLTDYAGFLLREKLDDFARKLIRLSFERDIPLLKFFKHLPEQQLFEMSKRGQIDFLTSLSGGHINAHISASMQRWLSDQIPLIGKYDLQADDLTLATHVRGKALKRLLPSYTTHLETYSQISEEIDEVMLAYQTASTDAYIQLLKDKVTEESNLSANIIQASPGITFIYDVRNQQPVHIAGKLLEVTGYTSEELMGRANLILDLIHPDDLVSVQAFIKRVMSQQPGVMQHVDCRWRTASGKYTWMRCYAVVYKLDAAGTPIEFLGVAYDISQEKQTEKALQNRERQLLEAQAITKIGSFEWDIPSDQSISTPELRKIFEADHRQTLDEMLTNVHPDDQEIITTALQRAFETGVYECQFRYLARSGEKMIDTRGVVVFADDLKPKTLVGTIQDITKRQQTEDQLRQKTIELEQLNERLQQFAYVASHDMKEPLRKIAMFSNLIMTSDWDQLPEKTKVNMQKISAASMRMQQLIEGILAYSSLDMGAGKELYALSLAVEEAINSLEVRIDETQAVIVSDGLPKAWVNPLQMQQLFQNLIANALKFSKRAVRPEIRIAHTILPKSRVNVANIKPAERYLQITIRDNGIGFNNNVAEKIFDLFQRLHSKAAYEGSGLGLAICKRIVQAHGGTITASSQEGEGSAFVVTLPYQL